MEQSSQFLWLLPITCDNPYLSISLYLHILSLTTCICYNTSGHPHHQHLLSKHNLSTTPLCVVAGVTSTMLGIFQAVSNVAITPPLTGDDHLRISTSQTGDIREKAHTHTFHPLCCNLIQIQKVGLKPLTMKYYTLILILVLYDNVIGQDILQDGGNIFFYKLWNIFERLKLNVRESSGGYGDWYRGGSD